MGPPDRTRWAAMLALVAAALASHAAIAEGPGTGGRAIRLEEQPAGPYLLRVVTSPTPPRVGSLFLEVRVTAADTHELLTDVEVTTGAFPTEGPEPGIEAVATHDFAPNPVEYAAHLPVTSAGVWEVRVRVSGASGTGEASFLQRISASATLGVGLSLALPVAGLAGLLLVFMLLQRRGETVPEGPA